MTPVPSGEGDPLDEGAQPPLDGFRQELLARVRAVDLFVLCAVPAVLVAVFALPEATRRSLAFAYTDPTPWTAFTAHYVHLGTGHLAGNLVGYGLLASVGYALAVLSGQRRFFLTALATFLLAFPFVLSALNLAVPRNAVGFGFSGINMALAGLLPLLLWAYARDRFFPAVSSRSLPAVFFLLAGWITLLALPVSTDDLGLAGFGVAATGLVTGVAYALRTGNWLRRPVRERIRTVTSQEGYGDLLVIGAVLLVGYPVVGFPTDPTGSGSVVNLYVHLLGFCLAFIATFILLVSDVIDE
ncbi:hypothetical protein [Halobellus rarus]|uniref:Rhomboid family intramembrane serine protease n=1 Tax=Halobellus rarus TaxID=1126237 RepID=A0ABD6CMD3_9EURY